jgi:hypothetical protein
MKTPLRYQFTGHDCGTAVMENALSYMIQREQLPPELIHFIYTFLLDGYTKKGWGFFGTSHESMSFFASWLKKYFQHHRQYKMKTEFYKEKEVTLGSIRDVFLKNPKKKICAVVFCWDVWEHYILVTGFTENGDVKIFDSYFRDKPEAKDTKYEIITDHPTEYNRIIPAALFNSAKTDVNFALGPFEEREAFFLIKDLSKRKQVK